MKEKQIVTAEKAFLTELIRTHDNNSLTASHVDQEVVLMGWVQTRRDHGGVVFVDLRDLEGLTQVVFDPQINSATHKIADDLRTEFCIGVRGKVRLRPEGMRNSKLPTGEIEIAAEQIEIFNSSPTPPFEIEDGITTNETVRLEYRYLDLRRKESQKALILRSELTHKIREFLHKKRFFEIETPFLTKSTPEGARDYLVPSRVYPGHAFALPQSPQLFKQILMVSGFERYYQIVRCFRDEDLRADRQPDFTQLDMELSFVNQDQIFALIEDLFSFLWKELADAKIEQPFLRMPYRQAVEDYGTDKPDLRLDWKLKTVTDVFKASEFKVFRDVSEKGGLIQVLKVPAAGDRLSRKDLDDLTPLGKIFGAKGIAWIKVNDKDNFKEGWQSPISKFLKEDEKKALAEKTQLENGDVLIFCADSAKVVGDSLGHIRLQLGKKLGALKTDEWKFLWVVDFPLFQYDEAGKRWVSEHHPFTSPKPEFIDSMEKSPGEVLSSSYDLVLNGMEFGSGSIRIHNQEVQQKIFRILNLNESEMNDKFGFLLKALSFGAPPHGGVAFGLDRMAMVLTGGESLRDVIAFPKTQKGQCLMTQAPSKIEPKQWKELNLKVDLQA